MTTRAPRVSRTYGRPARRPAAAISAAAALVAALGGCGDATGPLAPADIVGTYGLGSIGGQPLPTPTPTPPGTTSRTVILSDTITFGAEGTWAESSRTRAVAPDSVPHTAYASGTWVLDARSQTLALTTAASSMSSTVTFSVRDRGRTLVFTGANIEWRYVRQR